MSYVFSDKMLNLIRLPSRATSLLLLLAWMTCLPSSGCVRRRLTVRSNPPGALVFVDDQRIGTTPVSTAFTYYGTRKIQLFKDGYEPLTVKQRFTIPWYQFPGLDFVSENLWLRETRDERTVDFEMIPQQIVPNEEVLERAEMLRGNAQAGHVTPLWTPPSGQPPPTVPPQSNSVPRPLLGGGVALPPGS